MHDADLRRLATEGKARAEEGVARHRYRCTVCLVRVLSGGCLDAAAWTADLAAWDAVLTLLDTDGGPT